MGKDKPLRLSPGDRVRVLGLAGEMTVLDADGQRVRVADRNGLTHLVWLGDCRRCGRG